MSAVYAELLSKLTSEGCTNEVNKHMAIMVYEHLKHTREWRDLNLKYCNRLNQVYMTGSDKECSDLTVVIPMDYTDRSSMKYLADLFTLEESQHHRIVLAFCSGDGNVVYYEMGDKLEPLK